MSRAAIESLAALCAAVPDLSFTLTTSTGATLWVAEDPEARLCTHGFRVVIREWSSDCGHEPCIERVSIDGFDSDAAVLGRAGERWIVVPLDAHAAAAAIRSCIPPESDVDVLVRDDPEFGVSVVRFSLRLSPAAPRSAASGEKDLDEAALAAYAACLAAELVAVSCRQLP